MSVPFSPGVMSSGRKSFGKLIYNRMCLPIPPLAGSCSLSFRKNRAGGNKPQMQQEGLGKSLLEVGLRL